ncbi:myo-inositol 2-dehydrogenase/D-chiro-inositol 1-dehydrogenase [Anaerospora hongkongensis]|uniref:Myo-inositol 2-dehydrogenase/D-chiro-inositol 1-dehydrogenase n=1 Tax=Anaerospora hongkongensis TaxID=244830 RepID=A0A4R1PQH1_9FIRM|nr:inositol 2-dehydrogenase [Anaerospora hongkongensis]TCL32722.1 myo-inositol 2-dehydrogenase/D-chiro-inositol 1-dehydrogenase [Anaerospora hongkongensis]
MGHKIKVGVIGAGRIGKIHASNIIKNFADVEVKAVADINADTIRDWAAELGIQHVYADYKKVIEDQDIDAVIICSSTDTHSQITIEAAQAGKHIFCEKPIDYDIDRIHQALEAVNVAGVKFQVGFNRRFDHNFKKVRELIQKGSIGDVQIVKVISRDPTPPPAEYVKVSGGMFLDMTIHDFDMVRYLTGSEVIEVYANAAVLVDKAIGEAGDVDTALISLKFANGAIGMIDNCRQAVYGYDQRVEILGTKGSISVANDTPTTVIVSTERFVSSDKPKYFFLERYMESFEAELKAFFNCIVNDTDPIVTGIDGLKPVLIGLAAKQSYQKGTPIRL